METHPQFKDGVVLGMFFGVVLAALSAILLKEINDVQAPGESSYPGACSWTNVSSSSTGNDPILSRRTTPRVLRGRSLPT